MARVKNSPMSRWDESSTWMMGARAGEALAFWPSLAANLIAGTMRQTNVLTDRRSLPPLPALKLRFITTS